MLDTYIAMWQAALVPDESIVFWSAGCEIKLVNIARKPTRQDFMLLTMCCGESKVLLKVKIDECEATRTSKK